MPAAIKKVSNIALNSKKIGSSKKIRLLNSSYKIYDFCYNFRCITNIFRLLNLHKHDQLLLHTSVLNIISHTHRVYIFVPQNLDIYSCIEKCIVYTFKVFYDWSCINYIHIHIYYVKIAKLFNIQNVALLQLQGIISACFDGICRDTLKITVK